MDRSIELIAGQRHADLLAEAARQRLVGGKPEDAAADPAEHDRWVRLLHAARLSPAR